jgi:hypothetical protein
VGWSRTTQLIKKKNRNQERGEDVEATWGRDGGEVEDRN